MAHALPSRSHRSGRLPRLANSRRRYGGMAVLLHWGMALLLFALIAMGAYMVALPEIGYDQVKITLIVVHKALGMVALACMALRLAWRLAGVLPRLPPGTPPWQQVAARCMHLLLYTLMFLLPMTGWLLSSAGGFPVSFFGLFDLPDLIGLDESWFHGLITLHRWLAYTLLLLVVLHALAALHHHVVKRDGTLRNMWP